MNPHSLPFETRLWAKSDPAYPLWRHLLDVGAVARRLLSARSLGESLRDPLIAALLALHDIGKADPLFQLKDATLAAQLGDDLYGPLLAGWQREIDAYRHEARSAQVIRKLLRADPFNWSPRSVDVIGRVIRGHHGNFASETIRDEEYPSGTCARWRTLQRELCTMVLDVVAGAPPYPELPPDHRDVVGVQLSGVLVAADWIASNNALFSVTELRDDPHEHFALASDAATRALHALGLLRPPSSASASASAKSWSDLFGPDFLPRGVQQIIASADIEIPPGLVIIEASTGEGKTEAALFLAERWQRSFGHDGVYIALPTQATSNDLHRRYADFLQRNNPGHAPLLVHGMAWLVDTPPTSGQLDPTSGSMADSQEREAEAWIRNARRALLAPHAVGTIDQVLLAGLSVRFGFLRLLGLARKVLIVDEVHACDTYMMQRLGRVLCWCRAQGTPVILLSATLARSQRERLIRCWYGEDLQPALPVADAYPLVTVAPFAASGAGQPAVTTRRLSPSDTPSTPRSLSIELRHIDPATGSLGPEVERRLTGPARESGCAALIVNTVREAQLHFRRLRDANPRDDRPRILFHSRFPAWRRLEIEHDIRRMFGKEASLDAGRPEAALVVATQVLEQSLDVDFDSMVTAIAPIDALLQRAGRLHRHPPRRSVGETPRLSVVSPTLLEDEDELDPNDRVYGALPLLRTLVVLKGNGVVGLPGDYRRLIEAVYSAASELDAKIPAHRLEKAINEAREAEDELHRDAQHHLIGPPVADRFAYPNTAAPFSVDEAEEGEEGSNLRARTRHDDTSTAILAITREAEHDALRRFQRGRRDLVTRRLLMESRVPVPNWWLRDRRSRVEAERHPCYLFDGNGVSQEEPRIRFTPEEGVWFERDD